MRSVPPARYARYVGARAQHVADVATVLCGEAALGADAALEVLTDLAAAWEQEATTPDRYVRRRLAERIPGRPSAEQVAQAWTVASTSGPREPGRGAAAWADPAGLAWSRARQRAASTRRRRWLIGSAAAAVVAVALALPWRPAGDRLPGPATSTTAAPSSATPVDGPWVGAAEGYLVTQGPTWEELVARSGLDVDDRPVSTALAAALTEGGPDVSDVESLTDLPGRAWGQTYGSVAAVFAVRAGADLVPVLLTTGPGPPGSRPLRPLRVEAASLPPGATLSVDTISRAGDRVVLPTGQGVVVVDLRSGTLQSFDLGEAVRTVGWTTGEQELVAETTRAEWRITVATGRVVRAGAGTAAGAADLSGSRDGYQLVRVRDSRGQPASQRTFRAPLALTTGGSITTQSGWVVSAGLLIGDRLPDPIDSSPQGLVAVPSDANEPARVLALPEGSRSYAVGAMRVLAAWQERVVTVVVGPPDDDTRWVLVAWDALGGTVEVVGPVDPGVVAAVGGVPLLALAPASPATERSG